MGGTSWPTRVIKGTHNRLYDVLDLFAQKYMIHDRFTKHHSMIWTGYLDGVDMIAMRLVSTHTFDVQPESRQEVARR